MAAEKKNTKAEVKAPAPVVAKAPVKKAPAKKPAAPQKSKEDLAADAYLATLAKKGILGDLDKDLEFISTGCTFIDRAIGNGDGLGSIGGIPRGVITEIFGQPGSGKTTMALMAAAECQKAGGRVVWIDYERSLKAQVKYVKKLGINVDPSKFILINADNYEDGFAELGKALVLFKPDLAVIDSLAAAMPKAAATGDIGTSVQVGLHAKITSTVLSHLGKSVEKSNSGMIILNQTRKVIKASKYDVGPDEQTTGGEAIKFYPALRLECKVRGKEKVSGVSDITGAEEDKLVNQKVKVVTFKNKIDIPFVSVEVYLTFGKGFDNVRTTIDLGLNRGVIKKEGSWFSYVSPNGEQFNFKRQGVNRIYDYLQANPESYNDLVAVLAPSAVAIDRAEMFSAAQRGLLDDDTAKEVAEAEMTEEDRQALQELADMMGSDIDSSSMLNINSDAFDED